MNFLHYKNFFSKNQYGFLSKVNTEDALLNFLSPLYVGMNKNNVALGLFLNISKAFDTVSHSILIDKLFRAGVRGIPLLWIKSYLSGRTQKVKLDGILSDSSLISMGIPQ